MKKRLLTLRGVCNTFIPCFILQTLLVQSWYPMTVATNSRAQKQIIAEVSASKITCTFCTEGYKSYHLLLWTCAKILPINFSLAG